VVLGTLSPLLLVALFFILLSLPFDRVREFIARLRGIEGRAKFN